MSDETLLRVGRMASDPLVIAAQDVLGAFYVSPGVTTGRQAKALDRLRAALVDYYPAPLDAEAWYEAFEAVTGWEARTPEGRKDLYDSFRDAYLLAWGRRMMLAPFDTPETEATP